MLFRSGFHAYENNYTGIKLTDNWGEPETCQNPTVGSSLSFFPSKEFYCLTTTKGDNGQPYAKFANIQNNIQMLVSRWSNRKLPTLNNPDAILVFWYCNKGSVTKSETDFVNFGNTQQKQAEALLVKVKQSLNILKGI